MCGFYRIFMRKIQKTKKNKKKLHPYQFFAQKYEIPENLN